MEEKKLICQVCNKRVANSNNILSRHLRSSHNIEWSDYVVQYEHGGEWPVCICGCGSRLPWRKGGFGKYIKGHDSQVELAEIPVSIEKGWVFNPFSRQEEHIDSENEARFLQHCIDKNDPVSKIHSFKIGWEDSHGILRAYTPEFVHLEKRIIFLFEDFSGADGDKLLAAVKEWCDQYKSIMIALKPTGQGFIVVGGHKPREMDG